MRQLTTLFAAGSLAIAGLCGPAQAEEAASSLVPQDYDPAPAMWLLEDEDTTIYLLGTVHILPEGFRWRNPQLDAIIDEVDELVLESSDADADASMEHVSGKFIKLFEDRTPTSQQLTPAARPKWRRLIEMSGQPFDYVDQTPLMFAMMGFGMSGLDFGPSSYEHGVESVLEEIFADTDRPIHSIEDTGRVMMSIYRIDDALVLHGLEQDLLEWDGRDIDMFFGEMPDPSEEEDWELEHACARGVVQEEMEFGIEDAKLALAFHRALLSSRNERWSAWLEERLDSPGKILVAVGAGHFEGKDSVLHFLSERGLEAVRINKAVD